MIEEPLKIVGQLVMAVRDEDGDIVGERVAGNVVIYRKQFDQVVRLVDEALESGGG